MPETLPHLSPYLFTPPRFVLFDLSTHALLFFFFIADYIEFFVVPMDFAASAKSAKSTRAVRSCTGGASGQVVPLPRKGYVWCITTAESYPKLYSDDYHPSPSNEGTSGDRMPLIVPEGPSRYVAEETYDYRVPLPLFPNSIAEPLVTNHAASTTAYGSPAPTPTTDTSLSQSSPHSSIKNKFTPSGKKRGHQALGDTEQLPQAAKKRRTDAREIGAFEIKKEE